MRVVGLCLVAASLESAIAGPSKPEIYIGLNSESLNKGILGAIEPTIKWETSGVAGEYDVDGGLAVTVSDRETLPYSLWGRISKKFKGTGDLSVRMETESSKLNKFGFDMRGDLEGGTKVQVLGKLDVDADDALTFESVKAIQDVDALGGTFTLVPRYNLKSQDGDATISYSKGDTTVTVDADLKKQRLTVSQGIGSIGTFSPSVTTSGEVELEYSKDVGDGILRAGYSKPRDEAGVSYETGPWVATAIVPTDGFKKFGERIKLNVRRKVEITGTA